MRKFFIVCLCFIAGTVGSALADTLSIMPTRLNIVAPKVAEQITLRLDGNQQKKIQVRIFRWLQKDGKDVYQPTNEVVATPPVQTLRPNTDAVIRVVRVSKKRALQDETYRLFIDELPQPDVGKDGRKQNVGIQILTRSILPVIFKTTAGEEKLSWQATKIKDGYSITISNHGSSAVRMENIELYQGNSKLGGQKKLSGYVLPNSSFKVTIPGQSGEPNRLVFMSETGKVDLPQ